MGVGGSTLTVSLTVKRQFLILPLIFAPYIWKVAERAELIFIIWNLLQIICDWAQQWIVLF